MLRSKLPSLALIVPGLFSLLSSCGDDERGAGNQRHAKYVIASRIFSEDGADVTSYLHLVSSLDAGTEVDLGTAIEIPGSAKVFALEENSWLAVASGDGVTITRYEMDPVDGLVETNQPPIDLQPFGVQSLWETLYVASSSKAYYVDRAGGQLVIINPEEMKVDGTIKLDETVRDGYLALYSYSALRRGDKLLFSVGWFDWDNDKVLPETGLVVLDTKSDEVVRFDVDGRCGGITTPVTLDSGDTYYVSSALNGAAKRIERQAATPCALRVLDGEDRFDPDYALALADIAGGAIAGEPVPAGGDALFLRVLDESAVETKQGDASWDITGQTVWTWWKWEPGRDGKAEATEVRELEPSTADVTFFEIGDRVFGSQTTEDYAETTLIELTAEGGPQPAITVPGFASRVVEL